MGKTNSNLTKANKDYIASIGATSEEFITSTNVEYILTRENRGPRQPPFSPMRY